MATRLGLFETTLYFLGTVLIGVFFFTYGFFPLTPQSDEISSHKDVPLFLDDILLNKTNYKRQVSKVILMVIDALKYDFINHMPFTKDIEKNGKSCTLKLKIEVPTVTMPRIKSITTGSISNFIDVVINLESTQLLIDSIVHQMFKTGDRINFYGDNTWTNLFPNMFFRKQENFDSFYVNDFYDGDNNITNNLSSDLILLNWDFMILHYLGLDHIGHVEGPRSPKIYDKLIEMDRIIHNIYTSFSHKDINNLSNVLIVTADHGMRDSGGHGGGSDSEIFVPFIMFLDSCSNMREINYNQIDIAPTLAILLGFPIPAASIGKIIPNIINFLKQEEQLFALYYNTAHLIKKAVLCLSIKQQEKYLNAYKSAKTFHKEYIESTVKNQSSIFLFENAKFQYIKASEIISDFLISAYTKFDLQYIYLGLILSSFGTISLMIIVFTNISNYTSVGGLQNCSLSIIGILFLLIFLTLRIEILGSNWNLISIIIIGSFIVFTIQKNYNFYRSLIYFQMSIKSLNIFFGSITFAVFSLISSSFIEEEHQLWYYIGMTIFLYLAKKEISVILKEPELYQNYFTYAEGFTGNNYAINLVKKEKIKKVIGASLKWLTVFLIHIFIRRLNQTGDKWLHIEDIGDWLILEDNKFYLSIFFLAGLLMSAIALSNYNSFTTNILCYTAIFLIAHYRFATGAVELYYIKQIKYNFSLFIFALNILAIIVINYGPAFYKIFTKSQHLFIHKDVILTNITIFVLISILLHKPYNTILIPCCILTLEIVFASCDRYWIKSEKLIAKTILSIWIGKMFFFYQGNSNSLATIDLNSGYLFLNTYNPFIVGFFVTLNTYSGPICCILFLLREIFNDSDVKRIHVVLHFIFRLYALLMTFRLNFYLIVLYIFRQHLFIWTVFSPKFLYELYEFLLFIAIVIFNIIYFKILKLF